MKKRGSFCGIKRNAAGFLAAKRMGLSEQEYVDFLAKNPELYQISLLVEEQLKDCRQKWQGTPGQAFCASMEGALQNGSGDICQKQLADKIKELEKRIPGSGFVIPELLS